MDYKTFLTNYKKIYDEFFKYVDDNINKNVLKADEIVNSYLVEIAKGNCSLKSYKAKIIRNEQEHNQNDADVYKTKDQANIEFFDAFKKYFDEYLNNFNEKKEFANREKDLKQLLLNKNKEKQDLLNKKLTLEKEIQIKTKENDTLVKDKTEAKEQRIKELKDNLAYDLEKANEATENEYLEDERRLLDCDDLSQIKELKKKINECRLKGLEFELNAKTQVCNDIEEYEIKSIDEISKIYLSFNHSINEKNIIFNKLDYDLKCVDLDLQESEELYDLDQMINYQKGVYEDSNYLYELIKKQNEYIVNDFINADNPDDYSREDKLFIFDIALLNYYYVLICLKKNNCYDEFIIVIDQIIKQIKENKLKVNDYYSKLDAVKAIKKRSLIDALAGYKPKDSKETHESFMNNVLSSLDRFFNNLFKQIEEFYKAYFLLMYDVWKNIVDLHDNIDSDEIIKINNLPYQYMNRYTKYDYVNLEEYINLTEDNLKPNDEYFSKQVYEKLNSEKSKDNKNIDNTDSSQDITININDYISILNNNINNKLQEVLKDYNHELSLLDVKIKKTKHKYTKLRTNTKLSFEKKDKNIKENVEKIDIKNKKDLEKSINNIKNSTRKKLSSAKVAFKKLSKQLNLHKY